jgi:hypothetical protein
VSDNLYAPADLPLQKEPPVPTEEEAEWLPEPVWRFEENNSIALTGD